MFFKEILSLIIIIFANLYLNGIYPFRLYFTEIIMMIRRITFHLTIILCSINRRDRIFLGKWKGNWIEGVRLRFGINGTTECGMQITGVWNRFERRDILNLSHESSALWQIQSITDIYAFPELGLRSFSLTFNSSLFVLNCKNIRIYSPYRGWCWSLTSFSSHPRFRYLYLKNIQPWIQTWFRLH